MHLVRQGWQVIGRQPGWAGKRRTESHAGCMLRRVRNPRNVNPPVRDPEAFKLRTGAWVLIATARDDDLVSILPSMPPRSTLGIYCLEDSACLRTGILSGPRCVCPDLRVHDRSPFPRIRRRPCRRIQDFPMLRPIVQTTDERRTDRRVLAGIRVCGAVHRAVRALFSALV